MPLEIENDSSFIQTTAIDRINDMKARKKVIQGGTFAGKTYAIIPILISIALWHPRYKITVVAETLTVVKDGALDIFKKIMYDLKYWNDDLFLGSPLQYTFPNGSVIQFKSFDTFGKAKASGKRDVLFINECNHIPYIIAEALISRTTHEVFMDFNPNNRFWAHSEVLTESHSEFLSLTYVDNEALPPTILHELLGKKAKAFHNTDENLTSKELLAEANVKSSYWANWWKVYGLGEVGVLEGIIFQNWKEIATVPPNARLVGYGMDFGYTNDPTSLTAIYVLDGCYILDEEIYLTGLVNQKLIALMNDLGILKSVEILADSSDPKSIDDIKDAGFNIKGSKKGPDSILHGIGLMQEHDISVTSRSIHIIDEKIKYKWKTNKQGKQTNEPIGVFNHAMDGIRYWFLDRFVKSVKPVLRTWGLGV